MKTLIVEDDFTSRLFLQGLLSPYGDCHLSVNGREAILAFDSALEEKKPYDLVCLDIMIPEMDGQETLKRIREAESGAGIAPSDGVKIIMTTALDDSKNIMAAFREQCDLYLVKPIDRDKLIESLRTMKLIA